MEKEVVRKQRKDSAKYAFLTAAGILGFFLIWQLVLETGIVSSRILSKPTEVIHLFFVKLSDKSPDGSLLQTNILTSLQLSLTGLGLAIAVGVPLGWIMAWYEDVDLFVRPIFEVIRPIPPISWIPLTILWLGIGLKAKAFIIFFSAFIPCVINSYTGIKLASPVLINVAKTCGASKFTIFYKVGIPASLPMVFAGMRIALGNSWSTLVAAEMLSASSGLGYMILTGRSFGRPDIIILGMLVIGAVGAFFNGILSIAEKKVLAWRKTNDEK